MKQIWYEKHIIFDSFFSQFICVRLTRCLKLHIFEEAEMHLLELWMLGNPIWYQKYLIESFMLFLLWWKVECPKWLTETMGWQGWGLELTKHPVKFCLQKHWCLSKANQIVSWSSHWHNYLLIIILCRLVCRISILQKTHVTIKYVKWWWFNSVWD